VPLGPEPDEEVFFHGHPSWRAMLAFYIKGLAIAILAGVIAGIVTRISSHSVKVGWVIPAVAVVFVVVVIAGFIRRVATVYTISSQRLTIQLGIFSREMHETRVERIQNVNVIQSLLERMLRVGTVDFDTAAEAGYDFKFRGVADPQQVVRTVDRVIHQLRASADGV
jgi:uncharacterized membrane protein YdbT with pleckstrin-like domain